MSKISVNKKIGKSNFTFWVDDEDFREALAEASFYAGTPDKCGLCGEDNVTLDSNRTQEGYLYVKVRCLNPDCKAASTLGVYKDNKGGFWKQFEKYVPKEGAEAPAEKAPVAKAEPKKEKVEGTDEGYPF